MFSETDLLTILLQWSFSRQIRWQTKTPRAESGLRSHVHSKQVYCQTFPFALSLLLYRIYRICIVCCGGFQSDCRWIKRIACLLINTNNNVKCSVFRYLALIRLSARKQVHRVKSSIMACVFRDRSVDNFVAMVFQ